MFRFDFMGKKVIWASFAAVGLILLGAGCAKKSAPVPVAPVEQPKPHIVGGACTYDSYEGACTISSVSLTAESKAQARGLGGAGYEGYDVRFAFVPTANPKGSVLSASRVLLQLTNSYYPGAKFLKKYGLVRGKTFACSVELIKTGTCTPKIYKFKTIDLMDYFETLPQPM